MIRNRVVVAVIASGCALVSVSQPAGGQAVAHEVAAAAYGTVAVGDGRPWAGLTVRVEKTVGRNVAAWAGGALESIYRRPTDRGVERSRRSTLLSVGAIGYPGGEGIVKPYFGIGAGWRRFGDGDQEVGVGSLLGGVWIYPNETVGLRAEVITRTGSAVVLAFGVGFAF